jgi:HSP20 family molecular chaperone IbpA
LKVRPQEELSWHKQKLKQLTKERQQEIKNQQKTTAKIRENFKDQKNQIQLQGEEDLHIATLNNRKEISKVLDGKKEKLEQFKTDNIKHQRVLENQRLDLDKYNDLRTTDMNGQFETKYNDIFTKNSEKVKEFEDQASRKYADIRADTDLEIQHYRADMDAQLMDSAQDFGSRVLNNQDVQKEMLRRNDIKHASNVGRQRLDHKDSTSKLLMGQRNETESRVVLHKKKVETLEDHNKEQVKSKQTAFELKTQRMEKDHLNLLALMKDRFTTRLNDLKDSFSKKKQMVENKNSDPFYNVGKLSPTMKETPDSYIVSLKVPEHERENITISPRNRYIKITYHRKHSDRVEEQDGSSHTSKRTELMTKQFPTEAILNSKGVTQKYEDGVLKFKVLKA